MAIIPRSTMVLISIISAKATTICIIVVLIGKRF
uniref:7TM_GPCR_Srx domain-containing protein n=1 Tax=Heterorhabditis bacteriophora TaxID=37862 RepID=A0A1I7X1G6_HETBA